MNQFISIQDVRDAVGRLKSEGKRVALVPTMGALHDGHISLINTAKVLADAVVVSIFVNPTQFGPNEDYDAYPRPLKKDLLACKEAGVDAVFTPKSSDIYGKEGLIKISIDKLGDNLCGSSRPGHFNGVIQIVNKLFNIVTPDFAIFGQKDIQQLTIIKRMVLEFNHPVQVIMAPTVREADGLALSSRNAYLSKSERDVAPKLYAIMQDTAQKMANDPDGFSAHLIMAKSQLGSLGFRVDYFALVDRNTLEPLNTFKKNTPAILAAAAYMGKTRLIDNLLIGE